MSHLSQYWAYKTGTRPRRYWPGITPGAFVLGALGLVWLSPVTGLPLDVVVTTDSVPLAVAEGPSTAVVAYLSFGLTRIYLPVTVPAILVTGELLSAAGGRWGRVVAAAFGLFAAAQLLLLSGCGCGTGSVTPLGKAAVAVL